MASSSWERVREKERERESERILGNERAAKQKFKYAEIVGNLGET